MCPGMFPMSQVSDGTNRANGTHETYTTTTAHPFPASEKLHTALFAVCVSILTLQSGVSKLAPHQMLSLSFCRS